MRQMPLRARANLNKLFTKAAIAPASFVRALHGLLTEHVTLAGAMARP